MYCNISLLSYGHLFYTSLLWFSSLHLPHHPPPSSPLMLVSLYGFPHLKKINKFLLSNTSTGAFFLSNLYMYISIAFRNTDCDSISFRDTCTWGIDEKFHYAGIQTHLIKCKGKCTINFHKLNKYL